MIFAFDSPIMADTSSMLASLIRFTALELFQQGGFGFLANSFDIVQGRCYLSFASFIPVEGNGKAMYFILYLFQ